LSPDAATSGPREATPTWRNATSQEQQAARRSGEIRLIDEYGAPLLGVPCPSGLKFVRKTRSREGRCSGELLDGEFPDTQEANYWTPIKVLTLLIIQFSLRTQVDTQPSRGIPGSGTPLCQATFRNQPAGTGSCDRDIPKLRQF